MTDRKRKATNVADAVLTLVENCNSLLEGATKEEFQDGLERQLGKRVRMDDEGSSTSNPSVIRFDSRSDEAEEYQQGSSQDISEFKHEVEPEDLDRSSFISPQSEDVVVEMATLEGVPLEQFKEGAKYLGHTDFLAMAHLILNDGHFGNVHQRSALSYAYIAIDKFQQGVANRVLENGEHGPLFKDMIEIKLTSKVTPGLPREEYIIEADPPYRTIDIKTAIIHFILYHHKDQSASGSQQIACLVKILFRQYMTDECEQPVTLSAKTNPAKYHNFPEQKALRIIDTVSRHLHPRIPSSLVTLSIDQLQVMIRKAMVAVLGDGPHRRNRWKPYTDAEYKSIMSLEQLYHQPDILQF